MSTASPELSRELADWRERVESIAPTLRAHSAESVELRTLAPASVAALDQIEAFKLSGPREVGGLDAHPRTQLEAFTDLSRADISAGWCTMVQSMVAGLAGAHLQDGAVFDAAFADGYPKFSGTANPEGTAQPVDGGWLVNGRWSYASGIRHCGWTLAGVKLLDEHGQVRLGANGRPLDTAMAIPTDLVEIEDSWHVTGLSGTGSPHYHAEDLFLSADHRMPFGGVEPRRGGAWFNIPMTTFLVVGVTASCIGLAEHALELFQDYAGRTRFSMGKALGTRTTIRHDYSVAAHGIAAARVYAAEVLTGAWEQRQRGEPITRADESRIRAMGSWVGDQCLDAVRFAWRALGASANFADHPMDRLHRDMLAASNHVIVSEINYELDGARRLAPD